jgi:hypothetical protein
MAVGVRWCTPLWTMEGLQGHQQRSMRVKAHVRCLQRGFTLAAQVGDPRIRVRQSVQHVFPGDVIWSPFGKFTSFVLFCDIMALNDMYVCSGRLHIIF